MKGTNFKKQIDTIIPDQQSDDPKTILRTDKKILSIFLITLIVLELVGLLIGFIVLCVKEDVGGAFLMIFTTAISILQLIVLVGVAHNISRTTSAVLKIAEKIVGADKEEEKEPKKVASLLLEDAEAREAEAEAEKEENN